MIKLRALVILLAVFALPCWAQPAGRVEMIDGQVHIVRAKGGSHAAKVGEAIRQGDTVTTADSSEVHLKMDDGSLLALRPQANVTIVKYRNKDEDDDSFFVSLTRGALRSISGLIGKRNPSGVGITTPTATIGIRGTDHEVVVVTDPAEGAAPGTYDKVNAGGTRISSPFGTVELSAGQSGHAAPNSVPTVLSSVPAVFKPSRNDQKLEGLHAQLQRSASSAIPTASGSAGKGSGKGGQPNHAAPSTQSSKSGVQIQGNTTIQAVGNNTNAVAVGQGNQVSNKIGNISEK